MRSSVKIITASNTTHITAPNSALLGDSGNYFVFVKSGESNDGQIVFERRNVVVGLSDDQYFEIISGSKHGEEIVINGNYQLQYAKQFTGKIKASEHEGHRDHGHSHSHEEHGHIHGHNGHGHE